MTRAPRIVTVFVFTTITVVFWIFIIVYEVVSKDATVQVPEELLVPINPVLETRVLEKMSERTFFEEGTTVPLRASLIPETIALPQPTGSDQPSETNSETEAP